jgi:serine/threonine protein phosphatase PrpC
MNCGAASDTGLVRDHNEDRFWADPDRGAFLVVDGLGGQAAGELAAETAVEVIRACQLDGEETVRQAITNANNRIFALAEEKPELRGMACVLTLAVVKEGELLAGHVGDSRLYLIWKGAIRKLTHDHSPVGEGEDAGELSEAEAMAHPRRHEIFRDVGSRPHQPDDPEFIDIVQCRFRPDAALLLCSDGLTDHLTGGQLREIVDRYAGDPERVASELVAAANGAGGRDNITVLFVTGGEFRGRGAITRPSRSVTRVRRPARLLTGRVAFMAYGVLIGMLLWVVMKLRG